MSEASAHALHIAALSPPVRAVAVVVAVAVLLIGASRPAGTRRQQARNALLAATLAATVLAAPTLLADAALTATGVRSYTPSSSRDIRPCACTTSASHIHRCPGPRTTSVLCRNGPEGTRSAARARCSESCSSTP